MASSRLPACGPKPRLPARPAGGPAGKPRLPAGKPRRRPAQRDSGAEAAHGGRRPVVGITMGDPCGIGPEVILRALGREKVRRAARFVVIGNTDVLREVGRRLDLDTSFLQTARRFGRTGGHRTILIHRRSSARRLALRGKATVAGGRASIAFVRHGVRLAMESRIDALVTAPISKQAIAMAGFPYAGHTELLKDLTGARRAVMTMVGGGLRVALVTTHLATSAVARQITRARVADAIRILSAGLTGYFGIAKPRIAVCGLNPHAGEGGLFGTEEERAIVPAIEAARAEGITCVGPVPGDVVFHQALEGRYDGVVAMYHDQGCIPIKLRAFESGVNVTLGLPIIRTSPAHGTAYDIVRQGRADPRSMIAAIQLAVEMAARQRDIKAREAAPHRGHRTG